MVWFGGVELGAGRRRRWGARRASERVVVVLGDVASALGCCGSVMWRVVVRQAL